MKEEVGEICYIFKKCHISSFVADRDAPVGKPLPDEVKKAIRESDLFLVFLTEKSVKSAWVNQEIGYALGIGVPVIPIKKEGVNPEGLIESTKYINMQENPLNTVREIFSRLKGNKLSPKAKASIITFIGVLELKEKYGGH